MIRTPLIAILLSGVGTAVCAQSANEPIKSLESCFESARAADAVCFSPTKDAPRRLDCLQKARDAQLDCLKYVALQPSAGPAPSEKAGTLDAPNEAASPELANVAPDHSVAAVLPNKPTAAASSDAPAASASPDKPAAAAPSDIPVATASPGKPAAAASSDIPTATASPGKPAAAASSDIPTATASPGKPAAAALSDAHAAAASPDKPAAAASPDTAATTASPDKRAAAASPHTPAATASPDRPAATASSDIPATTASVEKPAAAASSDTPAATALPDRPAAAASSDAPAAAASSDKPAAAASRDAADTAASVEKPTAGPADKPAAAASTGLPAGPADKPTVAVSLDKPAASPEKPTTPNPPSKIVDLPPKPPVTLWVISETSSPVDFTPMITAAIRVPVGTRHAPDTLAIRCRGKGTELLVRTGGSWRTSRADEVQVEYRINDHPPVRLPWTISADGRTASYKEDSIKLLASLPDGAQLKISVFNGTAPRFETIFPLAGLDAAREKIAAVCKWAAAPNKMSSGNDKPGMAELNFRRHGQ